MADKSRIQVRTGLDPEIYSDVGSGTAGVPMPVTMEETLPTDVTKLNPSTLLSYNADDELVYADSIVDGITYRTTFTRSSMVIDHTLPISEVVEL